ncbi:MAG: hypothetical protein QNJ98_01715 [Planctomycetota bacterium]|nr:hypothetical protein [Planctomycetota bacterium]
MLGLGLSIQGCEELRMSSAAKRSPQTLTCAALAARGPGENAHVVVTDFMVVEGDFVYEPDVNLEFKRVWVPVVAYAERPAEPEPKPLFDLSQPKRPSISFRVLVESSHLKTMDAVVAFNDEPQFQGLVINEIDSLDSETTKLLREGYPGIDLDRVWIVEHKRAPISRTKALIWLVAGLALLGVAVWLFRQGSAAEPERSYKRRHPRRMGPAAPPREDAT